MSYLANSETTAGLRAAADFNCGWSVVNMLAELSLKSAPGTKPVRTPRRAVKAPLVKAVAAATEPAKAV